MATFCSSLASGAAVEKLCALGFDEPSDVRRVRTPEQFHTYLKNRKHDLSEYQRKFRSAQALVTTLEARERNMLNCASPSTQLVRMLPPHSTSEATNGVASMSVADQFAQFNLNPTNNYVNSSSIQSKFSPAAYLSFLYARALDFTPTASPTNYKYRSIEERRPDLKDFQLTHDNLNEQITTLSLVNELLTTLIAQDTSTSKPNAETATQLFERLKTTLFPVYTPFDFDNATVRESLYSIDKFSLNTLARRSVFDAFSIADTSFTLVPNTADRLRLHKSHVDMLEAMAGILTAPSTLSDTTVYQSWYGIRTPITAESPNLNNVDDYRKVTALTFDDFRMLLRDDVNVRDEAGAVADAEMSTNGDVVEEYKNIYARFLLGGWPATFKSEVLKDALGNDIVDLQGSPVVGDVIRGTNIYGEEAFLPFQVHAIMNLCIRLSKRTGLPLYQLDWLLTNAMYSSSSYCGKDTEQAVAAVLSDNSALNVLAHYFEWNEKYELNVDEFAAMIGDINCHFRIQSGEQTLMKKLFGSDAAYVTKSTRRYGNPNPFPLADLELKMVDGETMGEILRRGFGLSRLEWAFVLDSVVNSVKSPQEPPTELNSLMMGRIFRVVTLFRKLEWDIVPGILLTRVLNETIDATLSESVFGINEHERVLGAMDRLSWLADWMKETEFSAAELITLMNTSAAGTKPNQERANWVLALQKSLEDVLVTESDFVSFTDWDVIDDGKPDNYWDKKKKFIFGGPDNVPKITIQPEDWIDSLEKLNIIDSNGFVLDQPEAHIRENVEFILDSRKYEHVKIDYTNVESNASQLEEIIERLVKRNDEQHDALAAEISKLGSSLEEDSIEHLLQWMGYTFDEIIRLFWDWDIEKEPTKMSALERLHEISRYTLVVDKLELEAAQIEWVGTKWRELADDMIRPLSLRQVYLLTRFKNIVNSDASTDDWFSYFTPLYLASLNYASLPPEEQKNLQETSYTTFAKFTDSYEGDIAQLAANLTNGVTHDDDKLVRTVQQADYVRRRLDLCADLKISAEELLLLEAATTSAAPDWKATRAVATSALKRYSNGEFYSETKGRIDEEMRDALVSLYLYEVIEYGDSTFAKELREWVTDEFRLYEYLLLDVNVSSKVPTTRLLENIGAIQLYINRIVEKFDPEDARAFQVLDGDRDAWLLERQYRVWEASEKLKMFPGDYVEPELRTTKTGSFRTFENGLGGGDLSDAVVEQLLFGYLNDVSRFSELEDLSYFYAPVDPDDPSSRVIRFHFTGRANWENNQYYYRTLTINRDEVKDVADGNSSALVWTSWAKLDIPIVSQDHYNVVPAFISNRLFVMWLESMKLTKRNDEGDDEMIQYLQPMASRQNLDGTFTQPWKVPVTGKRRDVFPEPWLDEDNDGNDIVRQNNSYVWSWKGSSFAPDSDFNPIIAEPVGFMPYFDEQDEQVISYFAMPPYNWFGPATPVLFTNFKWTLTSSARQFKVEREERSLPLSGTGNVLFDAQLGQSSTSRYVALRDSGTATGQTFDTATIRTAEYELEPSQWGTPLNVTRKGPEANSQCTVELFDTDPDKSRFTVEGKLQPSGAEFEVIANLPEYLKANWSKDGDEGRILALKKITWVVNISKEGGNPVMSAQKVLFEYTQSSYLDLFTDTDPESNGGEIQFNFATRTFSEQLNPDGTKYGSINSDIVFEFQYLIHTKVPKKDANGNNVKDDDGNDIIDKITYAFDDMNSSVIEVKASDIDITATTGDVTGQAVLGSVNYYIGAPYEARVYRDAATKSRIFLVIKDENAREELQQRTDVVLLSSTAVTELTNIAIGETDFRKLFDINNGSIAEQGLEDFNGDEAAGFFDFLKNNDKYSNFGEPKPPIELDFYGAYGIYAWEIFYYIPMLVASKYRANGQYEEALSWLRLIYDPTSYDENNPDFVWLVRPLRNAVSLTPPPGTSDPDELSRFDPIQYRSATIRAYLTTLIEQGDAEYRLETVESLRFAKAIYTSAESLFAQEGKEFIEASTREQWENPTLGDAAINRDQYFRYPLNDETILFYTTIQSRLSNLRNWLSISGEPLNIPLVAPPIDPRLLIGVTGSALALQQRRAGSNLVPLISFEVALEKAQTAVKNLMYFGDLLTTALRKRDKQRMEELQAKLNDYVVESFEVGGQISVLKLLRHEKTILEKDKEEAEVYETQLKRFSDELYNRNEETGIRLVSSSIAGNILLTGLSIKKGFMKLIPTIFGTSNGGFDPAGEAEAAEDIAEGTFEALESAGELLITTGDLMRRQQENRMEYNAAVKRRESIELDLERLGTELGEEQGTLTVLLEKSRQTRELMLFQRRRSTNADYYNWYVGRITQLYSSAFDVTVRFCRIAERVFQEEIGDQNAVFIKPAFDRRYRGLLSGQSLMLDLQRMDLAYIEQGGGGSNNALQANASFSLAELSAPQLGSLKQNGSTMFMLKESDVDKRKPDEYQRRIKSVRLRLAGVEDCKAPVDAKLTLLTHRLYNDRAKTKELSSRTLYKRQTIAIEGAETDSEKLATPGSKFAPFQRCGIESTWALSFPAAVKAIAAKATKFDEQELLSNLKDVVLDVTYTCKA